jgi:hypothetical protein
MNKTILISLASIVVIGAGISFVVSSKKGGGGGSDIVSSQACIELCAKAKTTCPSLMTGGNCESACSKWSDEVKDKVGDASSCQTLSEVPEIVASLLPEINIPDSPQAGNDCEMACSNYSIKCLSLVPNASQDLYDQGLLSCMNECKKWNNNKTSCILEALDCESMTNVCGL